MFAQKIIMLLIIFASNFKEAINNRYKILWKEKIGALII